MSWTSDTVNVHIDVLRKTLEMKGNLEKFMNVSDVQVSDEDDRHEEQSRSKTSKANSRQDKSRANSRQDKSRANGRQSERKDCEQRQGEVRGEAQYEGKLQPASQSQMSSRGNTS